MEENYMERVTIERIIGFALLGLLLVLGMTDFLSSGVLFQGLIGFGLGYALVRGDFGFAGLANRTFRTRSTRLLKFLMFMFVISAIIVALFVLTGKVDHTKFWVNPISWGLLFGGLMFGIGMSFSSCCATGVLQDVPLGFSRALITLFFFGMGVYIALPWMSSGFVRNSLFSSASNIAGRNGVWFPDWFGGNTTTGIVLALLLTIALAVGVVLFANWFEKKLNDGSEPVKEIVVDDKELTTADRLFTKKWSMSTTALVIAMLFGILVLVSGGWGASTLHGYWFGRILTVFGVEAQTLADYTGEPVAAFAGPFFENGGNVRNLSIIIGAFAALLIAGNFTDSFKAGLKIKLPEVALFAVGGILLGIGTRLSMGCNVGALYTPIAQFSLAGWLYLVVLFAGGWIGNIAYKAFYAKLK
jgi:hypothetical protein